jgi:transcriptional regulator with XRE-family HTH domain
MPDLAQRRRRLRWSQRRLAEQIGVTESRVGQWEKGAPVPPEQRERIECELASGTPEADRLAERRERIVELVTQEPGIPAYLVESGVDGSRTTVRALLDELKQSGEIHERFMRYSDRAGSDRSRSKGLHPGSSPTGESPGGWNGSRPSLDGDEIKRLREEIGYSQSELARRVCVKHMMVFRWEHNQAVPAPDHAQQLDRILRETPKPRVDNAERTEHIGDVLRTTREQLGISLNRMARHLGVSPTSLSMWETGGRQPSPWRRRELLARLDELVASAR